ncbi:2-oxo-4-hydroxy-4-carboxy-5-ureidoimidazoline decarboxylase [Glycomyces paridis]|uniref:2-oxo-4-hydroxy-4-carboxy-5-ureidoimidazoline decarboxylase n=2 Tax=Glycomyces paridis TaxID=2126555 RepID=A0A4S8PNG6_9ACTN|nr:2-oxo-4-hydroxy-4-carboxy-5-ureidoimidazoline decarboxylase [Glycomyces paridis]
MWTIEAFDALDAAAATEAVRACCDSPAWTWAVVAGRPYANAADLKAAAMRAFDRLGEAELDAAHAAHPPIGAAPAATGTEAAFSRAEQAGANSPDAAVRAALAEANDAYRRRFGRVFLICATGLSAEDVLAHLHRRLGADEAAERAESAAELRKIVALRLDKLFGTESATGPATDPAEALGTERT